MHPSRLCIRAGILPVSFVEHGRKVDAHLGVGPRTVSRSAAVGPTGVCRPSHSHCSSTRNAGAALAAHAPKVNSVVCDFNCICPPCVTLCPRMVGFHMRGEASGSEWLPASAVLAMPTAGKTTTMAVAGGASPVHRNTPVGSAVLSIHATKSSASQPVSPGRAVRC